MDSALDSRRSISFEPKKMAGGASTRHGDHATEPVRKLLLMRGM